MPYVMPVLAVAGLVGGGVSAYGQYRQGVEEKQAQEYNAKVNEGQASAIRENAVLNEYRQRKELEAMTGQQTASYAKRGVNMTGSPIDVIADSISNAELEISIGKINSETEARNKESEARLRRLYGANASTNAKYGAIGTLLSSGVTSGSALAKEKWSFGSDKIGVVGKTNDYVPNGNFYGNWPRSLKGG